MSPPHSTIPFYALRPVPDCPQPTFPRTTTDAGKSTRQFTTETTYLTRRRNEEGAWPWAGILSIIDQLQCDNSIVPIVSRPLRTSCERNQCSQPKRMQGHRRNVYWRGQQGQLSLHMVPLSSLTYPHRLAAPMPTADPPASRSARGEATLDRLGNRACEVSRSSSSRRSLPSNTSGSQIYSIMSPCNSDIWNVASGFPGIRLPRPATSGGDEG